ncbi:MAG: tetratricopeptide repeat protein [Bacteroidia bacterium]
MSSPVPIDIEKQRQAIDELNARAYEERYNNTKLALQLAMDALSRAMDARYPEGQAWALRNVGIAYAILGESAQAEPFFQEALALFERLENMRGLGLTYSNLGTLYQQVGKLDRAIEFLSKSLRYLQLIPDLTFFYAQTLYNLAVLFSELEQDDLSREYQEQALKLYEKIQAPRGVLFSLLNLTRYYQKDGKLDQAEELVKRALEIASDIGEEDLVVRVLLAQAELLNRMNRYQEAIEQLQKAEALATEIRNPSLILAIQVNLADTYLNLGLLDKAKQAIDRIEELRPKTQSTLSDYILAEIRAKYAERIGDYAEAYRQYQSYVQRRLALQRAATKNALSAVERIIREDLLGVAQEAPPELQVARRIQEVILHSQEELRQTFADSALWLLPKSLVSGDFLWVGRGKDGAQILIVGDASGAGISAAMLSTLAHTLLYEIVTMRGVTDPGRILSQMHKSLLDLLYPPAKKSSPELEAMQAEGFQMGVCVVFPSLGEVHYAGANIPLWVFNPLVGWESFTPDRRLLGQKMEGEERSPRVYTSVIVPIEKQWVLVFMTDGWERQVRASDGKRYGRSAVRDFLMQNPPKNLQEWVLAVRQEFDNWRQGAAPTDDVLVVAVRL